MNSPATSVARLRTNRSAIVVWLLISRKNRCKPFLEFCNTIGPKADFASVWPDVRCSPRLCCKTLFGPLTTYFRRCGRGDRIIARGTTATNDELTGNFGNGLEDASVGDCRLVALFAKKSLPVIFGVLQHYPPESGRGSERAGCPL